MIAKLSTERGLALLSQGKRSRRKLVRSEKAKKTAAPGPARREEERRTLPDSTQHVPSESTGPAQRTSRVQVRRRFTRTRENRLQRPADESSVALPANSGERQDSVAAACSLRCQPRRWSTSLIHIVRVRPIFLGLCMATLVPSAPLHCTRSARTGCGFSTMTGVSRRASAPTHRILSSAKVLFLCFMKFTFYSIDPLRLLHCIVPR